MKYDINLDITLGTSHSLILNQIKPKSKVLEFGSASGYMTKYMKEELDCEVTCIEIDSEAAEKARKYSKTMIVADIEKLDWFGEISACQFDYILFADVLEHLRNPEIVLKQAITLLNDDGIVMTSVPNIGHNAIIMELMEGRFDYQSIGLLDDTHVHFFTRKSLLNLLNQVGLEPFEWLTTMRRPETTEFKQAYKNFPVAVSRYLENRLDGDVYQFVTFSRKKRNEENSEDYFSKVHKNYLDLDHCQVFWGNNSLFKEEFSVQKSIVFNEDFITYSFTLPEGQEGELRFDPANTLVTGQFKSFKIYTLNGSGSEVVFNLEEGPSSLQPMNDIYIVGDSSMPIRFISLGNDPSFLLTGFSLSKEKQYVIEIQMQVTNNAQEIVNVIVDSLEKKKKKAYDLQGISDQLENELKILEVKSKELNYILENERSVHSATQDRLNILELEREKLLSQEAVNAAQFEDLLRKCSGLELQIDTLIREKDILSKELASVKEESRLALEEKSVIIEKLETEIQKLLSSISWRSTAIFRSLANTIRRK